MMSFPEDDFDALARIRTLLSVPDHIDTFRSNLARIDETHRSAIDQLRLPIDRSRLYVEQIGALQGLARSAVAEYGAAQNAARSAVAELAAAQQLRTKQFESLASSLRLVDTASLIGARLGQLGLARSGALAAYERVFAAHRQIDAQFARMTRGIDSIHAVSELRVFAIPAVSRELLVANYVVESVSLQEDSAEDEEERRHLDEVETDVESVSELLELVDPDLVNPYQGIKDALKGDGADKTRHVLTSGRELWLHLLRRLAPDNEVTQWAKGRDGDLIHNGKPTRRARVLYICRRIDDKPLTGFVQADARAFTEHVNLFNRLHELRSGFSDRQLRATVLRTDSWLDFIIRIWKDGEEI